MKLLVLSLYLVTMLSCPTSTPTNPKRFNQLKWSPATTYHDGTPLGTDVVQVVYRSVDGVAFTQLTALPLSASLYQDFNIQPNRTYWYRLTTLKSSDPKSESIPSNTVPITAKP